MTNYSYLTDYSSYRHSYAFFIKPKLKSLRYNACVRKMPASYIMAIIKNALNNPELKWTDKEQEFFHNCCHIYDSVQLYYYCKNAVNKAEDIIVRVDQDGELI